MTRPMFLEFDHVSVARGLKVVLHDLTLGIACGESTSPSSVPTAAANPR